MPKPKLPEFVLKILSRLNESGYPAFIVGGPVRDMLIGNTPQDWDIATPALPDAVCSLFEKTVATGVKHGTVTVILDGGKAEVTTYRTEGKYSDNRRPDSVNFVLDLKEDLSRRDFTINAMAMSPKGVLTDYFGGASDLEKGIIRCVGNPVIRFEEDALRMLRALRFKAVLGFKIEDSTMGAIKKCAHLATALSAERVRDEIRKILLSGSPETLESLVDFGLLNSYLKPLSIDLGGLSGLCINECPRLCALCEKLIKNGLISSAEAFLTSLRFPAKSVSLVSEAIEILKASLPRTEQDVKKLLRDYGTGPVSCAASASYDEGFSFLLERVLASKECWSLKQLKIDGKDMEELGFRGTQVGAGLNSLLEHVIMHPTDNERNILLNLSKNQLNNLLT